MKYSNPLYQRVSRATIKNDCIKIFETEKDKIKKNLEMQKWSHLSLIVGLQIKPLVTFV
jgi:hypothetical protein